MTDEQTEAGQLDAAIVAVLGDVCGEVMAWRDLRELLPEATYWHKVEALTRLVERGVVDVSKDGHGRNYVALSLTPPYLRARGVA